MTIKILKIELVDFNEAELTLAVDTDVLTVELATEINNFWGEPKRRLSHCNGDVVLAVANLFALAAIAEFYSQGGICMHNRPVGGETRLVQRIIDAQGEGWPSAEDLGIHILDAYVELPEFTDMPTTFSD